MNTFFTCLACFQRILRDVYLLRECSFLSSRSQEFKREVNPVLRTRGNQGHHALHVSSVGLQPSEEMALFCSPGSCSAGQVSVYNQAQCIHPCPLPLQRDQTSGKRLKRSLTYSNSAGKGNEHTWKELNSSSSPKWSLWFSILCQLTTNPVC